MIPECLRVAAGVRPRPCLIVLATTALLAAGRVPAEARQFDRVQPQVLIGATFTTIAVDHSRNLGVDWRVGVTAGGGVTVPLGTQTKVALLPEVLFTQKGGTFRSATDEHIRTNYLEVTGGVQLDVLPAIGGDRRILLQVAPTFAWNLSASRDVNGTVTDIKDSIETFEAGLLVGASVPIVKDKVDVGARFEWGLTRLFRNADDTKNRSLIVFVTPHLIRN
jgi:type II secretory pathway component GspD/PulD (secretin)